MEKSSPQGGLCRQTTVKFSCATQTNEMLSDAEDSDFVLSEHSILPTDDSAISSFLHREFACPVIQGLYPHMHWVAKRNGSKGYNVDALHHLLVKGRNVVASEDPELHLLWYKQTIWVKPFPRCLLSTSFWEEQLSASRAVSDPERAARRRDVLGFVRSYAYLIQHESDFRIAQDARLIPVDGCSDISYLHFRRLISRLQDEPDSNVSERYRFGQIRLFRLNWLLRFFQPSVRRQEGLLGRLYYHQLFWDSYGFVQEYIAPFVFIFATLSVVLSAMQVGLAVETAQGMTYPLFENACWGFQIFVLVGIVVFMAYMTFAMTWNLAAQVLFGSWVQRKAMVPVEGLRRIVSQHSSV
jgi:hypothetical protein